ALKKGTPPPDSGRPVEPADLDPPDLRPAFEIGPGELLRMLGLELVMERLRVVIIDQNQGGAGQELVDSRKDPRVTLRGLEAAHIEDVGGLLACGVRHVKVLSRSLQAARRRLPPDAVRSDTQAPV